MNRTDPPTHTDNGDLVGDIGPEIYSPHTGDTDCDHDVGDPGDDVDTL